MIHDPIFGLELSLIGVAVYLCLIWFVALAGCALIHEVLWPDRR